MKNIILKTAIIFITFFNSHNVNSQIITIKWGEKGINGVLPSDFQSTGNYYYKDVDNYLENFKGTWEYTNGSEKFQIILTKVVNFHQIDNDLNLNYYEDGIVLQYKKFINNVLVFESPNYNDPNFRSMDSLILSGYVKDYGRITKTLYMPHDSSILLRQGGFPISATCRIEKLMTLKTQPKKIKFTLYPPDIPNYDYETYTGQPTFSIPNEVILTKVN